LPRALLRSVLVAPSSLPGPVNFFWFESHPPECTTRRATAPKLQALIGIFYELNTPFDSRCPSPLAAAREGPSRSLPRDKLCAQPLIDHLRSVPRAASSRPAPSDPRLHRSYVGVAVHNGMFSSFLHSFGASTFLMLFGGLRRRTEVPRFRTRRPHVFYPPSFFSSSQVKGHGFPQFEKQLLGAATLGYLRFP